MLEQRNGVRRKEKKCYVLTVICPPPHHAAYGVGRGVWSEGLKFSLGKGGGKVLL